MATAILTVHHEAGLHARPAATFVKAAAAFPCAITVRNLDRDKKAVNAKSMVMVLTQGVVKGQRVELIATGEREDEAIAALRGLIESNFD